MEFDEWKNSGRPRLIQTERFKIRFKEFVTGDFSKVQFLNTPLNTGGLNDPPYDESTWEYEEAQNVDKQIEGLVGKIVPSEGLRDPTLRCFSKISEAEKEIIQSHFGSDIGKWNDYLLELGLAFKKMNLTGTLAYIKNAGLIEVAPHLPKGIRLIDALRKRDEFSLMAFTEQESVLEGLAKLLRIKVDTYIPQARFEWDYTFIDGSFSSAVRKESWFWLGNQADLARQHYT